MSCFVQVRREICKITVLLTANFNLYNKTERFKTLMMMMMMMMMMIGVLRPRCCIW